MGKYIHLFQSKEEFNQAVDNNFTKPWVSYTEENDKVDYYKTEEERKLEKPFTIEATQDGTKIYFRQSPYAGEDGFDPLKVEASTDNGKTWREYTAALAEDDVPGAVLAELNKGETVLIRGKNEAYGCFSNGAGEATENCNFYADKPCYVYGNIMSLVDGDDFARLRKVKENAFAWFFSDYNGDLDWSWVLSKEGKELLLPAMVLAEYCYYNMFYNCEGLTVAPKLPATMLADYCYCSMFSSCTSLITAPELPAMTLAEYCYQNMFQTCTGLTVVPELPATVLTKSCYYGMFSYCTSLTTTPKLPATTLAKSCYHNMFIGCTGLTSAPILPATTLADGCYSNMFRDCTGLTTAPELPATTLADNCYNGMFYSCTGLISAPELPVTTLANYCYSYMFMGCTSLAVAPELPATTLKAQCYQSMFNSCTNLTVAPELPAITLAESCYNGMFYGCTNLSYIKAMFTTTPGTSYTRDWVDGVKATGTFVKNSAAKWNVTGNDGVPSGWTVETASE